MNLVIIETNKANCLRWIPLYLCVNYPTYFIRGFVYDLECFILSSDEIPGLVNTINSLLTKTEKIINFVSEEFSQ